MMSSMNAKSIHTAQTVQSSAFEQLSVSDGDAMDSDDESEQKQEDTQFEMDFDDSEEDSSIDNEEKKMNQTMTEVKKNKQAE